MRARKRFPLWVGESKCTKNDESKCRKKAENKCRKDAEKASKLMSWRLIL